MSHFSILKSGRDDDVRCCEMCKMFSGCVKLRQSDQNLCESCHSCEKSLTRSQENIIGGETQSEMASAMMVPHSLSEDDGAAMAIEQMKLIIMKIVTMKLTIMWYVVHVIVTHLRQTKETPEKNTGERNSRKRSSYKGQSVKINMARQRTNSSPFPKVNLLYKVKENPTVIGTKLLSTQK